MAKVKGFCRFSEKCTLPTQGVRSVPVISVPSRREAGEVYPLEVYYPDDPTRLCRLKAGQSLVLFKIWQKGAQLFFSINMFAYYLLNPHSPLP